MIYLNEDGGTKFDGCVFGKGGIVVGVDGCAAAAYVGVPFVDCDVEGDVGGVRVLGEVICRACAAGSGAYDCYSLCCWASGVCGRIVGVERSVVVLC